MASLMIILFFGGSVRYIASLPPEDATQLKYYNGSIVEIKGTVDHDPEAGDKSVQIEVVASSIKNDGSWHNIKGKVLLFASGYNSPRYGDILEIKGRLETPGQLGNFDYRGYLANQGIYSTMSYPALQILQSGKGNPVISWIYAIRNRMADSLARTLPEPQASLAQGIFLGMRGNIPQDVQDAFARSGTAHILAISGQHLSIVAGILITFGIWLFGRRHYIYIWLALILIWIYVLMTGANAPVIRSAVMTSLFLFAEFVGRQRSAGTALAFTAAVMIGISPAVLWSVSFQMSFLAISGLVYFSPLFMEQAGKMIAAVCGESGILSAGAHIIADSACVTLAAIIAVWPVVAYYFNIVSLIAPVSALLAVPAMTGIISLSAVAGGVGILFVPLGQVTGWMAWLFLSYLLLIVKTASAIPASFIRVNSVSPGFILAYYFLLISTLVLITHRKRLSWIFVKAGDRLKTFTAGRHMKKVTVPVLVIAALVAVTYFSLPDNRLHVNILNVGQGDAILIQRGTQQVLVDGGPSAQTITNQLGKYMPFWDRNIELVVMTHPDSDHLTGLVEVLRRYNVEKVLSPGFNTTTQLYAEWRELLAEKKIETTVACKGQSIDLGNGIVMNVLSPEVPAHFAEGSDDNSMVMRLVDGKFSFLLTADIYTPAEQYLMADRTDLQSTVLKVAHHGSAESTSAGFLNAVSPSVAVISVGKDNDYGHPASDTLSRLDDTALQPRIYRTDENGTVECITDGTRLWVQTEE